MSLFLARWESVSRSETRQTLVLREISHATLDLWGCEEPVRELRFVRLDRWGRPAWAVRGPSVARVFGLAVVLQQDHLPKTVLTAPTETHRSTPGPAPQRSKPEPHRVSSLGQRLAPSVSAVLSVAFTPKHNMNEPPFYLPVYLLRSPRAAHILS